MFLPNTNIDWSIKDVMKAMVRGAEFSPGGLYRPRLYRDWDRGKPGILLIMLNPSTADEYKEDPTVRRCIGFAHDWGYGWLEVRNIFSYRSTDPSELYEAGDPVGPDNPLIYRDDCFDEVIFAWGNHGRLKGRGEAVIRMFCEKGIKAKHLGVTKLGQPKHPLYLSSKTEMQAVSIDVLEEIWRVK